MIFEFQTPEGTTVRTNDPHLPELRKALASLQAGVEAGGFTPKDANATLGKIADSMAAARAAVQAKKQASPPASRSEFRRRAALQGQPAPEFDK